MKNRRGSVLALTLMIFASLMILGMFTLSLAVNENKQAMYHQNKKRAYYIARSGAVAVEAAILAMSEEEIEELDRRLADGELVIGEIDTGENKANVVLNKNGNKLFIESVGKVGEVSEKITRVMVGETDLIYEIADVDKAVFSNGDITINNGTIDGDIGTNNNIRIEGSPTINGNAYFMEGNYIDAPDWWIKQEWSDNKNKKLDSEMIYPLPVFPEFPVDLVNKGSIKTTYENDGLQIDTSAYYENLNIIENRSITINTVEGDIILGIENFDIQQGFINVVGSGNVKIFINNFTSLKGGINKDGNSENVQIYYNGKSQMKIDGATEICGSLYIKQADFDLTAGGSIKGNLVSGGEVISISGGTFVQEGMIYAPNAYVNMTGSGSVYGTVIANEFYMSGGARVEFKPEYIDTSLIDVESTIPLPPSSSNSYKPGYFK